MPRELSRRDAVRSALVGAGFLTSAGWVRQQVAAAERNFRVSTDDDIERLAERIMESDPGSVVDLVVGELETGLSRKDLLAACLNAGIRFHGHHSAYVAHPVRAVSDTIHPEASLLPLFYHLSVLRFRAAKSALRWLDKSKIPAPDKARDRFHSAMKSGERDDAGLAMISMCRSRSPRQAYSNLFMYAAERNHNSGGHTAISVVNTLRVLESTDWRCSESAVQFAVTDEAWRLPGGSQVWSNNRERAEQAKQLPLSWSRMASDEGQTRELLDLYRRGQPEMACKETFERLRRGSASAGSVWDAVFLATAEMVVRYQFVGSKRLAGHSMTCANALNYLFRTADDPATLLYCLLEAVEWTNSFLARERARPALRDFDLLALEPAETPADKNEGLNEIFSLLPPRRFAAMHRPGFADVDVAMRKTLAWIHRHGDVELLQQRAMWLMCLKSTPEVHDFKYPMALFENSRVASALWRPRLLAASLHVLHGTDMEDSPIVHQSRQRLG